MGQPEASGQNEERRWYFWVMFLLKGQVMIQSLFCAYSVLL